jgi:SAM-dependent methyltransferase
LGRIGGQMLPQRLRRARRQLIWWGRARRCPICRASLRRLLPEGHDHAALRELDVVGGECWDGRSCPVCFANTRTRLLWHWLDHESGLLSEHLQILHVAPEFGIYWRLSALPNLDYRAVDLDPQRYAYAGPVERADLTDLELPDGSVDLVLANHVLEHVVDDARALSEIRRVLRPGGVALLQVPISHKLERTLHDPEAASAEARERVYGQRDHLRLYARDYYALLERSGFQVDLYAAPESVCATGLLNPRERLPIASALPAGRR